MSVSFGPVSRVMPAPSATPPSTTAAPAPIVVAHATAPSPPPTTRAPATQPAPAAPSPVQRVAASVRRADLESARRVSEYLGYVKSRNDAVWPGFVWEGPVVLSRAGTGAGYHLLVNVSDPGPGYELVDAAHRIYARSGAVPDISGFAFRDFAGRPAALFDLDGDPPTEFANFALHEIFHRYQESMPSPVETGPAITESLHPDNGAAIRMEIDVLRRYVEGRVPLDEALADVAALRWYRARSFPRSLESDVGLEAIEGTARYIESRLLRARGDAAELRAWEREGGASVAPLLGRRGDENTALQMLLRDKAYFVGATLSRMATERLGQVDARLYSETPWGVLQPHVGLDEAALRQRFERLSSRRAWAYARTSAQQLAGAYARDVRSTEVLFDPRRRRVALPDADWGASSIMKTVYLPGDRTIEATSYSAGSRASGFSMELTSPVELSTRTEGGYRLQALPQRLTVSIDGGAARPLGSAAELRFARSLTLQGGRDFRLVLRGAGSLRRQADGTWVPVPPRSSPLAEALQRAARDTAQPGWLARLRSQTYGPVATERASH